MIYLVLVLIFCALAPTLNDDQWFVVGAGMVGFLAWQARHTFRWPTICLGAYLAVRALYTGAYGAAGSLPIVVITLRQTFFIFLIALAGYLFRHNLVKTVQFLVPLAAIATLVGYPPLSQNSSLNSALLVAGCAWCYQPWVLALVVSTAVLRQGGATAMILAACLFAWRTTGGMRICICGLWALLAAAKVYHDPRMLDESSRWKFWGYTWQWFTDVVNPWFGSGLGTFLAVGPAVQHKFEFYKEGADTMWRQAHCDWLQLLVETGWIGLALAAWLYVDALLVARRYVNKSDMQALIMLGLCSLWYFPMQAPLMALFCVTVGMRAQARS